jgi:hypothetical protein
MNRRSFLGALIGGMATAAAVRTFPFRVFSFPSEVTSTVALDTASGLSAQYNRILTVDEITRQQFAILVSHLNYQETFNSALAKYQESFAKIGQVLHIRKPSRFNDSALLGN